MTAATAYVSTDTVQWEVSTDGGTTFTNISGATSTTYTFTATAAENGDEYQAVFTNSARHAHEQRRYVDGRLRHHAAGQPEIMAGQNVTFTAASLNPSGTDTVQWQVSTDGGTTFTDYRRRDLDDLQLHGHLGAKRRRVRGRLHQQRRQLHQQPGDA